VNPRTHVHRRTADRARRFPDVDPRPLLCEGLSSRDAALARAIDHAVARRWLTLAVVIDSRLTEQTWDQLDPSVQSALLVGAAQLLLMEKIPDHAAIDQAVRWIKTTRRARAAGLVNAVLRNIAALRGEVTHKRFDSAAMGDLPRDAIILSDGRLFTLNEPIFAEHVVTRLAQQTSHCEELIGHWMAAFDRQTAMKLALHGLVHAPIIVHTPAAELSGAELLRPHDEAGFAVYVGNREELHALLAQHPQWRVQDPATAKSIHLARQINPLPDLIIDYCAGKGTKTRQLAEMFPYSRIIATEKDHERFTTLRDSLNGVTNVHVVPFQSIRDYLGKADFLVLDVPCSNTGVLARRVEAKYRFTRDSLAALVKVQRQILADSLPLMKEDAWLLYATCSVEPIENQQQVKWMSDSLPLSLVQEEFSLPNGLPGDPPNEYHDGGYAALMRWQVG
jgi:16S rRNA (cytosine967-C5)-methyltransferase